MTWGYVVPGDWPRAGLPPAAYDLRPCLEGLTGSDAPTGPWALVLAGLVMACGLRRVVEVGVWKAATTAVLAHAARCVGGQVWAVDADDCHEGRARLARLGLEMPWCRFARGDSRTAEYDGAPIDLLLIDGDHSYEGCLADWHRWSAWLRVGGWAFVHDVQTDAGVRRAVDEVRALPSVRERFESLVEPAGFGMAVFRRRV